MSCQEIFKFNNKHIIQSIGTIKNASRGSYILWEYLSQKYLGKPFNMFNLNNQEFWDLFYDSRLSLDERIVLGSTYDFALVKKEDLSQLIKAQKKVFAEMKIEYPTSALKEEYELLESIMNDDFYAIGWHRNSVSCDMWDEYDLSNSNEHWFLFDEIQEKIGEL